MDKNENLDNNIELKTMSKTKQSNKQSSLQKSKQTIALNTINIVQTSNPNS